MVFKLERKSISIYIFDKKFHCWAGLKFQALNYQQKFFHRKLLKLVFRNLVGNCFINMMKNKIVSHIKTVLYGIFLSIFNYFRERSLKK